MNLKNFLKLLRDRLKNSLPPSPRLRRTSLPIFGSLQATPALAPLVIVITLCLVSCRGANYNRSKLDAAEELLRQDKYDEAIKLYEKHMNDRLSLANRPEWENPFFYYLLIGDIELRRSNVNGALENYKLAQGKGVHEGLISDRMRYIASWYEEKGELEEAIAILKANRQLDPLLFDAMLDRISKELIEKHDKQKAGS